MSHVFVGFSTKRTGILGGQTTREYEPVIHGTISLHLPVSAPMPLVVDRARLPEGWPTNHGEPAFWEELGRTVATFAHLEDVLARAHFALAGSIGFADFREARASYRKREKAFEQSLTDPLDRLAKKLERVFNDDERVPDDCAADVLARLDRLRTWRNALSHGAWQSFEDDGSITLRFFRRRKGDDGPEQLNSRLTLEYIASIRAEVVHLTVDIVDIVSAAGVRFPGTELPGVDVAEYLVEQSG